MATKEGYKPTESDILQLAKAGLSLEEALQFDSPPEKQMMRLNDLGLTLIDAILLTNVRKNILDALAQIAPLRHPADNSEPSSETIAYRQEHFIHIVEVYMWGNPYMGENFSRADAEKVLEIARATPWTLENFAEKYDELLRIVE